MNATGSVFQSLRFVILVLAGHHGREV